VIIVEGPDGGGKSTLVEGLCMEYGLAVGERAVENRDLLYKVTRQDTYTAIALEIGGQLEKPTIWDRLFWSEMVYADVVGRPVEFQPYEQDLIKKFLSSLAITIVCLPPKHTVLENVAASKHEMDGVKERAEVIYDRYRSLFQGYGGELLFYDYTGEQAMAGYRNYDKVITQIDRYIDLRKGRLWTPLDSES
jgi:thymidylate kinase